MAVCLLLPRNVLILIGSVLLLDSSVQSTIAGSVTSATSLVWTSDPLFYIYPVVSTEYTELEL